MQFILLGSVVNLDYLSKDDVYQVSSYFPLPL